MRENQDIAFPVCDEHAAQVYGCAGHLLNFVCSVSLYDIVNVVEDKLSIKKEFSVKVYTDPHYVQMMYMGKNLKGITYLADGVVIEPVLISAGEWVWMVVDIMERCIDVTDGDDVNVGNPVLRADTYEELVNS